jgi:hypothetical protein
LVELLFDALKPRPYVREIQSQKIVVLLHVDDEVVFPDVVVALPLLGILERAPWLAYVWRRAPGCVVFGPEAWSNRKPDRIRLHIPKWD